MGGLMSITGAPGEGPMRVGIPIADLTAGLFAAQGIFIALLERELGKGQDSHLAVASAIFMLDFQASRWTMSGEVAGQAGNNHPTSIPTAPLKPTTASTWRCPAARFGSAARKSWGARI